MNLFNRSRTDSSITPLRGSRWKRRLLGAFLLLVAVVILSPVLVAQTPLRNWIADHALTRVQFQGDVRIGGASLWWFSAPAFTDIEVRDAAGRTMLQVPQIEAGESLAGLLSHPLDLGVIRVTQPVVHVVSSGDTTNLETALAVLLQKKDNEPDAGPALEGIALRAECTAARLLLEDEDTGRVWTLDPVDLSVAIPHDRRTPLQLALNAAVADAHETGHLIAELTARLVETTAGKPSLRATGELRADALPLAAAEPFLRRFQPQIKLDGRFSTHLTLREGDGQAGSPDARLEGDVSLQALALSDPLLGPDCLRLARVETPCRLALEGSRVHIEQLEVQSDIGKLCLAGTVDLAKDPREVLTQPGHRIEAVVDLARLSGLVPNTLHLTKDTRIESGTVSLHVHSSARPDSVRWEGDLRTSDLQGLYQGQCITWKEPLAVVFVARQEANALPVFERFRCDSDFLRLEMSGSLEEWSLRGGFNLGRLTEHLAGFVDLGPMHLQGEGTMRVAAKRNSRGGSRVEGDVQFAQLNVTDSLGHSWREDRLTVRLDLVGDTAAGDTYRVDAAGLHILAGQDGIDLDLLEPIAKVSALRSAAARLRVHGDLARWHGRLRNTTGLLDGARLAGQIDLDGRLRYESDTIRLDDIKVAGRAVRFEAPGVCVNEPTLDLTTSGRLLLEREALELGQTRLSCPSVTMQTPAVSVSRDAAGALQITSSATLQGDVARLSCCVLMPPPNAPDTLGGAFAGRVDLRPDNGRQVVQLDLNVQDLVLGSATAPAWREPRIHLAAHGIYDLLSDSFQLVQVHLDSPALSCEANGQLTALRSDMELLLEGKLNYDLERLEPQLRPYLGTSVKLAGRDVRPFRIAGALASPAAKPLAVAVGAPPSSDLLGRLRGEAGMSWQSLQTMGCQVGPADLRGKLADGWFRAAPIEATLNQGRLHLEPSVRLAPGPQEMFLAKGRVIDHARLTPAACASGLGYALPVIANVAQAEGELSLDLDGGQVPLTDPLRAELAGRVTIHSATVSGGPLAQELSVLLKGPATLTLARENVVSVRVVNGRVYHNNLELHFPELTVRTSGSVGVDGSLALIAEMPVPPKWLGSSKLAQAVAGQTIRLPIGGTLSSPKLDQQALRAASAQFVRDTTENVIRQELDSKLRKEAENGLKRLFRPR
jgi:hypothetical protein